MGIHTYSTVTKPKLMVRATLTATSATYYTASTSPATTAVITNIVLINSSGNNSRSATVTLNGVLLLSDVDIKKGTIVTFVLEQVLPPGHVLAAFASDVNDVQLHVSGVEVT